MLKKITFCFLLCSFFVTSKTIAQCTFTATLVGPDDPCTDGMAQVSVIFDGGTPPYAFQLATNVGYQPQMNYLSGQPLTLTLPFNITNYFLMEVTDALGCIANASDTLTLYKQTVPSMLANPVDGCDIGGGLIRYDLYARGWQISNLGGLVNWYFDAEGTQLIPDPEAYIISDTTNLTVYASLYNGPCESATIPVELNPVGMPIPIAYPATLETCSHEVDGVVGTFQLNDARTILNGGTDFSVIFYEDAMATTTISTFQTTTSDTVFARVRRGPCYSEPVPLTLIVNPTPNPSISGELSACENSPTTLSVNDGYGTYTWSDGSTTPSISVNAPGVYSVTIVSEGGCSTDTSMTVESINILTPEINGSTIICNTEEILLEATANFNSYTWSNGHTTSSTLVNQPGSYEVSVTDELGCIGTSNYTIETLISLDCHTLIPASNQHTADGRVGLIIEGGEPPYQIVWNGPITGSQIINTPGIVPIDNLSAGDYSVSITGNDQCMASCNFTIESIELNTNCLNALQLPLNPPSGDCDVFTSTTFTVNNINNNTLLPGHFLDSCLDSLVYDSLLSDRWLSFEAVGDVTRITFQNISLTTPLFAFFKSAECYNARPINCSTDHVYEQDFNTNPGTTYYIMVAGGNDDDRGNFFITIQSKNHCFDCLIEDELVVTPAPENGYYYPGQQVHFCYNVSTWNKYSSAWFHALEVQFGGGWDLSTLVVDSVNVCTERLNWYDSWISCTNGQVFGPGFAFEYPLGSCGSENSLDPGDNYGCSDIKPPTSPPAQFCWTITVANCPGYSNNDLSIGLNAWSDAQSGGYLPNAYCSSATNQSFSAQTFCTPELSFEIETFESSCDGEIGSAYAYVHGGSGLYTYQWSTGQETYFITDLTPGQYSVTVNDGLNEISQDFTITSEDPLIEVNIPTLIPLCQGFTYPLDATVTNCQNCSYLWNNGATEPVIEVSEPGSYKVTVTSANSCQGMDSTQVVNHLSLSTNLTVHTCSNPYVFAGQSFTEPGQYEIVLTALTGCDSVFNLNLTFLPETEIYLEEQICEGETYELRGNVYSETGLYTESFTAINDCDTTIILDLEVIPIPSAQIHVIDTLVCAEMPTTLTATNGIAYLWSTGETSASITVTPINDESYSVTIFSENDCQDTAAINISVLQVPDAAFVVENQICVDTEATITFQGQADNDAYFFWDFGGGIASPGIGPGPHEISWAEPGLKTVSLTIEENGCMAETYTREIEVEPTFPNPSVSCVGLNNQLAFGWAPVPGATGYEVNVLTGQSGILSNNIFIVAGLIPDEEVAVEVIAFNGGGICNDGIDTLSCSIGNNPILMLTAPQFELDEISETIQVVPESSSGFEYKGPYPNPTKLQSQVELVLDNEYQVGIELIDIRGRKQQILTNSPLGKGSHLFNIETKHLPSGIYFVKMQIGDHVISQKLIVIQ